MFICVYWTPEKQTQSQVRTRSCREDEQTSLYLIFFLYAVHVCYHDDQIPVATHVFYCTEQSMDWLRVGRGGGFLLIYLIYDLEWQ